MTVTIVVGEMTDKPIQCYYLTNSESCDECASIVKGDTITVKGQLKHYYNSNKDLSTFEFDRGCTLEARTPNADEPEQPVLDTPEKIVNALYALDKNATLPGTYTLTGVVTEINYAWDESKNNMTVTIVVGGMTDKPVQCYYLTNGENCKKCADIAVGDTITVKGQLKHYYNSNKDTSTFLY